VRLSLLKPKAQTATKAQIHLSTPNEHSLVIGMSSSFTRTKRRQREDTGISIRPIEKKLTSVSGGTTIRIRSVVQMVAFLLSRVHPVRRVQSGRQTRQVHTDSVSAMRQSSPESPDKLSKTSNTSIITEKTMVPTVSKPKTANSSRSTLPIQH
jgi:hypothetical protein